jgi:hypothetical protein
VWFLLPLLAILVVDAVIVAYALLVSVAWSVGAAVDTIRERLGSGGGANSTTTSASVGWHR